MLSIPRYEREEGRVNNVSWDTQELRWGLSCYANEIKPSGRLRMNTWRIAFLLLPGYAVDAYAESFRNETHTLNIARGLCVSPCRARWYSDIGHVLRWSGAVKLIDPATVLAFAFSNTRAGTIRDKLPESTYDRHSLCGTYDQRRTIRRWEHAHWIFGYWIRVSRVVAVMGNEAGDRLLIDADGRAWTQTGDHNTEPVPWKQYPPLRDDYLEVT